MEWTWAHIVTMALMAAGTICLITRKPVVAGICFVAVFALSLYIVL